MKVELRQATSADAEALWSLFLPILTDGTTFAPDEQTGQARFLADWFGRGGEQWVAEADGRVVGAYTVRPNQPGRGAHVATASYGVDASARGLGVGLRLGTHSLERARALGYAAIQFNFVVSTNTTALRLWKRLGFRVLATLPGAFRHRDLGAVDACVLWRDLR